MTQKTGITKGRISKRKHGRISDSALHSFPKKCLFPEKVILFHKFLTKSTHFVLFLSYFAALNFQIIL